MSEWVLILGGSTGHGAAIAKRLAKDGYGIIAFHFDRGEAKQLAAETIAEVNETTGGRCHYFNTNAAAEETVEATDVRDAENEYGTYREAGFIFGSISLGLGLLTGGLTPFVVWEE